jgi:hypothetical protein
LTNSTATLREALRDRFQPPDWLMAFEVQVPRPEGGLRFADAVAYDLRKGVGSALHGFEIKVSRGDWLNELRKPTKHLPARALTDHWWIVSGDRAHVHPGELPAGVGLMAPGPKGLQVLVPATRNPLAVPGVLDRDLVAAMLRRLDVLEPRAYWEGKILRSRQEGYREGRNSKVRIEGKKMRSGAVDNTPLNLP